MPNLHRLSRSLVFPLFFAGLIVAWELSIGLFHIPRYILPAPSEVVESARADFALLLRYMVVTTSETVLGYAVAKSRR